MIVNKINEYLSKQGKTVNDAIADSVAQLAKFNFIRQMMTDDERKAGVRLSSCGKCPRAQAYNKHGFDINGKEMDSRSHIVFYMGDVTENMMIHLALLSGVDLVEIGLDQKTVALDIGGVEWLGHPDGTFIDNGSAMNFEAKSMSSFAFRRAEKGELDHGYLCQAHSYMKAKGHDKTVMLYMNKDSGVLGEIVINWNEAVWKDAERRMLEVNSSLSGADLPAPEFTPDAKGHYPWNCLYCANHKDCCPNAQKVLVGRSYKLKASGTGR